MVAYNVFTDGGWLRAAVVVYPENNKEPQRYVYACEGSAQFKELMAIALALSKVSKPMNLFSDSLYVGTLLPGLLGFYIQLDGNPITPLMIQICTFLRERQNPIYLQHRRGHRGLPGILAQGNMEADKIDSAQVLSAGLSEAQGYMTSPI